MKEEKLFGFRKWDVTEAADTLSRVRELEKDKPELCVAAVKYLERKQKIIGDVIRAARRAKGKQ